MIRICLFVFSFLCLCSSAVLAEAGTISSGTVAVDARVLSAGLAHDNYGDRPHEMYTVVRYEVVSPAQFAGRKFSKYFSVADKVKKSKLVGKVEKLSVERSILEPRSRRVAVRAERVEPTLPGDNRAFAVDMYKQLRASEGNLFFSPYSVSAAMAMSFAGARGETEKQIAQALHFSLGQDKLHQAFTALEDRFEKLNQAGKVELRIANSIWPAAGLALLDRFEQVLKNHYKVSIKPLDFQGAAEAARKTINQWVEKKTADKIKNLLKPGMIVPLTRLVLVNAVYFKGKWRHPFKAKKTRKGKFYLASGQIKKTPLMAQTAKFQFAQIGATKIVSLPYEGRGLSMVLILPKTAKGLVQLEKELNGDKLTQWQRRMRQRKVRLTLPRFKMTWETVLNDALNSLGVVDAFSSAQADFSGIAGPDSKLFISLVAHKAFIEVNEEGTEAAAATAVGMLKGISRPKPPVTFRADHPFLFMILENRSNSILFMGRVSDPTHSGE